MPTIKETALAIAARGVPVFPVHGITPDGRCTCGKTLGECTQKSGKPQGGKHPITTLGTPYPRNEKGVPSWTLASSTSPEVIEGWFRLDPYYNIALHAGAANAMETDFDGPEGIAEFEKQYAGHPEWFNTPVDRTGNGYHVYHQKPEGFKAYNTVFGEVRVDDQYSVISPSQHYSGRAYTALEGHELSQTPMTLPPTEYLQYLDTIKKVKETQADKAVKTLGPVPAVDAVTAMKIAMKYYGDNPEMLSRLIDPSAVKPEDDRSKILYILACKLYEHKIPYDEFIILLKSCPYNKFRGRRDEDAQITGLWGKVQGDADDDACTVKYSDVYNSDKFVETYGDRLRYAVEEDRFYVWDEHSWVRDSKNMAPGLIKEMLTGFIRQENDNLKEAEEGLEAAISSKADKDTIEQWERTVQAFRAYLKKLCSSSTYENVLRRCQRDYREVNVSLTDFDKNTCLFNTENATLELDLTTTGIHARDQRREDMITRRAPVKYDPDNPDAIKARDEYLQVLRDVYNNDEKLVKHHLQVRGLGLTGKIVKALFVELGEPDSGKSTLKNVEMGVLGDVDQGGYAKETGIDTFLKRNHAGELRADLISLRAARVVWTSEANRGMSIDEELVKKMTGEDMITARGPYMTSEITYKPMYKILIECNEVPYMSPDNEGMMNRVRVIPHPAKFTQNPNPANPNEKPINTERIRLLSTAAGRSGILLAWLDGLDDYYLCGGLIEVEAIREKTSAYRNELDNIKLYVSLRLEYGTEAALHSTMVKHDVYLDYHEFMREEGVQDRHIMHERKFNREIRKVLERVYVGAEIEGVDKTGTKRVWKGIAFKQGMMDVAAGIREHSLR